MNNSLLADPYQKKLLKKWSAILESGKPIENESTKITLAQILENTRNFFKQTGQLNEGITQSGVLGNVDMSPTSTNGVMKGPFGYTATGDTKDFYLPNVVMPMLRRIMPDLIANELVGVQPLNGPVGYALAYRPIYGSNGQVGIGNLTSDAEIGYKPTDTRWTGVSSETSALTGDFWGAYAGTNGVKQWTGEGQKVGDAEYASLAENTYPTVSFGLIKSAVEAKTRKLAAHWSPELAEDMQAMHGIDVEREMVNTLTYEVGAEIDRQIVTEMVKSAIVGGSTSTWTPISADGLDQMGRLATLLTQITIKANDIAIKTRRGNGNFVITTPRVCALLQQLSMNKFSTFKNSANIPTVPDSGVGALAKVGLINDDSQLLIRDSYVQDTKTDYVLIGYKGKQAGDSGIIYCPYVPLQLSKVIQPGSFTPSVGARTRYGIMSSPWDAKNYYQFMRISDMTSSYTWDGGRYFVQGTATSFDNTMPLPKAT